MKKHKRILYLFLVLLITQTSCNLKNSDQTTQEQFYSVKRVVDGDTFVVEDGSKKGLKIRLIGVDAPESRNAFKKKTGYYGKEAKAYVKNLLTGKKVRLVYDVTRNDMYGRTLAYVYMEDGTFLNALLVKEGYAMVMTFPPNVAHADTFVLLQREARENNRGLWNMPVEDLREFGKNKVEQEEETEAAN